MRRFFLLFAFTGFCCAMSLGQMRFLTTELGLFSGVSNYMGDLQQVRFDKDELHEAYGVYLRYNFGRYVSLKFHAYKGVISGSDSNFEGLLIRQRNLSFRSDIFELGAQWEFSFTYFGESQKRMASPYFFVGASWFFFNPQAFYQGEWIDLQPLGTEGQGILEDAPEPYSLRQWAIPMGVGFVMSLSKHLNLGFELGFRKTFTDYLDDVSGKYPDLDALREHNPLSAALSYRTPELGGNVRYENPVHQARGNSADKDMYFFGGLTLSWTIRHWVKIK